MARLAGQVAMPTYNENAVEDVTRALQALQAHTGGEHTFGAGPKSSSGMHLPQPDAQAVERSVERYVERNRRYTREARPLAAGTY
jgi:hypothetical protein